MIGANLPDEAKKALVGFFRANSEVFAWSHEDMLRIDPKVISHKVNVRPDAKSVIQRKRSFAFKRSKAIEE